MRLYIVLFNILICVPSAFAQIPTACNGTASAIACDITCISCNFNGFSGSTEGYPSGIAPEFCGTVENVQWLGFIAGATQATFTITPTNCVNGDGVQVALYNSCDAPPLACDKGEMGGGSQPVSISVPMLVGANYFLLVDGYAGDQCLFTVAVDPPSAVFEPPLGIVQDISGPTALCPGAVATYQVQPVSGASAYIWTGPPGTLFDSMPSPATISGAGGSAVQMTMGTQGGQICVQAANTCATNAPCTASLNINVLDDSARPVILTDTLVSLPCTEEPLKLSTDIQPLSNLILEWHVSDSIGHIVGTTTGLNTLVDQTGTYHFTATNWQNGCSSSVDIRVTEPVLPASQDIHLQNIRCYGETNGSISIGNIPSGTPPFLFAIGDDYFQWYPGKVNLPAKEYEIHIQDALGCTWDTLINLSQPDELLVNLPQDTTIQLGEMLILWDSAFVSDKSRVERWILRSGDMGDTTNCSKCLVMPLRSFYYTLQVVDSAGCTADDGRKVLVATPRNVFVPNVFAPASDEIRNEKIGPYGGDDVSGFNYFLIFDRWGQKVHEARNLSANDSAVFWDGRIRSNTAPPGVYAYLLEVQFKDGYIGVYRGDITLIR